VLCLSATGRGAEHRRLVVFDTEQRQRYELDVLTQEIAELELELATAQAEIADFSVRYHAVVGSLMVELDRLTAQIAALEAEQKPEDSALRQAAEQSRAQAERSQQEQRRFEEAPDNAKAHKPEAKPFAPSRDLKKLYRQIAQKIHPDRAASEDDRNWRTHLMSEATRAYRNEDEIALREVMTLWQEGPIAGAAGISGKNGLEAQLLRMKARLAGIQAELDRLLASRLYELFIAARLAQRQSRDLLQEMAATVDLQIAAAHQRLKELQDTIRPEETA
jgi:hypothetical protein